MQPIVSTRPYLVSTPRDLHYDDTCITRSHAYTSLEVKLENPNPTCFQPKQIARSRCVSYVDIHPSVLWRNRQTKSYLVLKPKSKNIMVSLRPKSPNRSCRFWGSNQKIIDLGFEAQPRNLWCSSPYAQYWSHTASPDLLIIQPPSTWLVLGHPRSSTPGLLFLPWSLSLPVMSHLLPVHHEISKCDSLEETRIKVKA
jgi:hypothetical protein